MLRALKSSWTWPTRPHSQIKLQWISSRRPARTSRRRKRPPASSITSPSRLSEPSDCSTAVAEAAVAEPVNGTIEIAGLDAFPIDEIVGKVLEYDKDPRTVVVDPEALYFGVKLNDQSLIPGPNARHGSTKFDWWLTHVPPQKK